MRDSKNGNPSQALVPVNVDFQGMPVRIVVIDGKKMMPVIDIGRSLNIPRNTLSYNLKDRLLLDKQAKLEIVTKKGVQKLVCVTNLGAIGLLYKVNSGLSEDPQAQERILKFQNWATETIEEKMQTKIVKEEIVTKEDWSSVAIGHIRLAREIAAQNPDADAGMCIAIGIREAERATGMDLSPYKKLIPPSSQDFHEEYVTATQIAKEIGNYRRAEDVNRYLVRTGYLYRGDDGVLYLTASGAQHGRVYPGAFASGHNGYFIKWKRSIIAASRMRENNMFRISEV